MNIFALDQSPYLAARHHCDRHVVKMVLETAQILCTAATLNGVKNMPYKPTHEKHPCVLWAARNRRNYNWLCCLGTELHAEYYFRYKKEHKSYEVIRQCMREYTSIADGELEPFSQCMPEKYRIADDPIQAYRNYYFCEKLGFAAYKKGTPPPDWLIDMAMHELTVTHKILGLEWRSPRFSDKNGERVPLAYQTA